MIRIWATARPHLTKRATVVAALGRMTGSATDIRHRWLESVVLAVAMVALVATAATGPGWGAAALRSLPAANLDHTGSAPLFDLLGAVAIRLPFGEPAFRIALLGAVLGGLTLAGAVRAARLVVPNQPAAGAIGPMLLLLAPAFREAISSPAMLAACGTAWTAACAADFARGKDAGRGLAALACTGIVIGSAPWLGALLAIVVAIGLVRAAGPPERRDLRLAISTAEWQCGWIERVVATIGMLGALAVALWIGAVGALPELSPRLAPLVAASGAGATAVLVGSGLLGASFAAITAHPAARLVVTLVVVCALHALIVADGVAPLLVAFAIAVAVIPAAVARALPPARELVAVAAGVPLVAAEALTGVSAQPDAGNAPTLLAHDLTDELPPGPGVFVATRAISWFAVAYEFAIADARPDLALAPLRAPDEADVVAADALRAEHVVGSDAASFGRLDVTRARPRGRGFQLLFAAPGSASVPPPPARYATDTGDEQATLLALERARYEAASGRLDAAARAAGLTDRFGAADLAVLATTAPSRIRPALFGFVPALDDRRPGRWLLELFGDDLAWVAGLDQRPLPADAPAARKLHAKWREIWLGKAKPDDPAIAALGSAAVAATKQMLAEIKHD